MARMACLLVAALVALPAWGVDAPASPPPSDTLPEDQCPEEIRAFFELHEKEGGALLRSVRASGDRAAAEAAVAALGVQFREILDRKQQLHAAKRTGGQAAQAFLNQFAAITTQQTAGAVTRDQAVALRNQAWSTFASQAQLVKLVVTTQPTDARVQWSPAQPEGWRSCRERFAWVAPGRYLVRAVLAGRVEIGRAHV